jgi:hypothetical protein
MFLEILDLTDKRTIGSFNPSLPRLTKGEIFKVVVILFSLIFRILETLRDGIYLSGPSFELSIRTFGTSGEFSTLISS